MQSDTIYAGGLFDGDALGKLGPVSHRAAIPAFHVTPAAEGTLVGRALDVRRAVFTSRSSVGGGNAFGSLEQRWYAPLDKPSLLVHEMAFSAAPGSATLNITLDTKAGTTRDLNLTQQPPAAAAISWLGHNIHGELGNRTDVAMVCSLPDRGPVLVPAGSTQTLYFITAVVTSLNSTDPLADAAAAHAAAMAEPFLLMQAHEAAWAQRWEQGSLEVAGDLRLARPSPLLY